MVNKKDVENDFKKLNEKLMKFVGIFKVDVNKELRQENSKSELYKDGMIEYYWNDRKHWVGSEYDNTKPDLVNDPRIQMEYLYPKIIEKFGAKFEGIEYIYDDKNKKWFCLINLFSDYGVQSVPEVGIYTENPAVAFALACGKLVDDFNIK